MNYKDIGIIEWLENILSGYDKVFLVLDKSLYKILEAENNKGTKTLFLSLFDIPLEDRRKLCELYLMYEFSDGFQILCRNECFGSLMNFIDTGLLTNEELIDALLCKK